MHVFNPTSSGWNILFFVNILLFDSIGDFLGVLPGTSKHPTGQDEIQESLNSDQSLYIMLYPAYAYIKLCTSST